MARRVDEVQRAVAEVVDGALVWSERECLAVLARVAEVNELGLLVDGQRVDATVWVKRVRVFQERAALGAQDDVGVGEERRVAGVIPVKVTVALVFSSNTDETSEQAHL